MGAVWALIVVLLLGGGTAAATVAYVRVTDHSRSAVRAAKSGVRQAPTDATPEVDREGGRPRAEVDG